jgi:hypothetical protein
MLKHSGLLSSSRLPLPSPSSQVSSEMIWKAWKDQENTSRLVYGYVLLDQELSLFHDVSPLFSTASLTVPMPDSADLYDSPNAQSWAWVFEEKYAFSKSYTSNFATRLHPVSLSELFQQFLDDSFGRQTGDVTAQQLRLLLHSLQSLMFNVRQLLGCFSDSMDTSVESKSTVMKETTLARLAEVQVLLKRWYDLSERYTGNDIRDPVTRANLVMYHLISLNTITSFPEIEALARGGPKGQGVRGIQSRPEALIHCGQILRLISSMPNACRPPWWAAAIYRVALVLWASAQPSNHMAQHGVSFAIDAYTPEHLLVRQFLEENAGVPMVTSLNGRLVQISRPDGVLEHCIGIIDEATPSRFSDGIKNKLSKLRMTWGKGEI